MLPAKFSFYLLSAAQPYDPEIQARIRENIMVVSQTLEQLEEPFNAKTLHDTLATALGSVTGTILGGGRYTVLVQQFPVSESKQSYPKDIPTQS